MIRIAAWPLHRKRGDNPYSAMFADGLKASGFEMSEFWGFDMFKPHEVVVVHWPDNALERPGSDVSRVVWALGTLLLLRWQRMLGARIVWVAHNVTRRTQRTRWPQRWIAARVDRVFNGVVAPSEWSAEQVVRHGRVSEGVPVIVVPHGPYEVDSTRLEDSAAQWRSSIAGSSERLLLHFGQIRKYKGVEQLLEAFEDCDDQQLRLHITGRCQETGIREHIEECAGRDARITYHLEHLSEETLLAKVLGCDLVCLPYEVIDNSGSLLLALSACRPALAPSMGAIPEIRSRVGEAWISMFDGRLRASDIQSASRATPAGRPDLEWCAWSRTIPELTQWLLELVGSSKAERRY